MDRRKQIEDALFRANEEIGRQQNRKAELQRELDHFNSFDPYPGWVVLTRCIDTGRITGICGIFTAVETANRFAAGMPGYGVGKDIFVEEITHYITKDA